MEKSAIKAAYDKAYFESLRGTKEGIRIGTSPEYNYYKNLALAGIKLDDPVMDVLKPYESDFKIACDPFTTANASCRSKVMVIVSSILAKLDLLGHNQLIKNAGINPDWIIGHTDNPCLGGLRFIRDIVRNYDKIDTPVKKAEREAQRKKQSENAMEKRRLAIVQKEAELAALKANDPFGLYDKPPVKSHNLTAKIRSSMGISKLAPVHHSKTAQRAALISSLSKAKSKIPNGKSSKAVSKINNDPFGIYKEKESSPELLKFPKTNDLAGLFGGKSQTKRKGKKSKKTRKH
jgi:hypothetical protein